YIARSLDDIARRFNKSKPEIDKILEESRAKLLAERNKRPRPHLDDKILTDWNSLMISSLAFGGRVLDEPEYTDAAKKAADFILANLMDKNGRLLHRWREGEAAINGMLDDYAFLINGLIDLYEATFDLKYLEYAVKLTRQMLDFFWDEKEGGFFFTADGSEKLIIRHKDVYDGAIPSGNSFAALDLIRLSKITTEGSFDKKLEELLNAFSGAIRQMPSGYFQTLISLDFVLGPSREIVIVGEEDSEDTKNMIRMIYKKYIPNKVVIFRPTEKVKAEKATSIIPDLKDWPQENNKTTVYVCTDYVCDLPVTSLEELENVLEK
ncbi:MAG: thioredoxin domain-containing protein, partial [Candidatus Omnitrophota bacterium]